jgi:hypothetical protein
MPATINRTIVDRIAKRTGATPDVVVAVLMAALQEIHEDGP